MTATRELTKAERRIVDGLEKGYVLSHYEGKRASFDTPDAKPWSTDTVMFRIVRQLEDLHLVVAKSDECGFTFYTLAEIGSCAVCGHDDYLDRMGLVRGHSETIERAAGETRWLCPGTEELPAARS